MGNEWEILVDVADGKEEGYLCNAKYEHQEIDCFGQKGTKRSYKLCKHGKPVLYFRWNFDEMEGVSFEQDYLESCINGKRNVDRDLSDDHLFHKDGVFWEKYKGSLSYFQREQIKRKLADQISLIDYAKEYVEEV